MFVEEIKKSKWWQMVQWGAKVVVLLIRGRLSKTLRKRVQKMWQVWNGMPRKLAPEVYKNIDSWCWLWIEWYSNWDDGEIHPTCSRMKTWNHVLWTTVTIFEQLFLKIFYCHLKHNLVFTILCNSSLNA